MEFYKTDESCIVCGEREKIHRTIRKLNTNEGKKWFEVWLCLEHFSVSDKEIQEIIGNPINLKNL
jgi:uncharacterized membrane protein YccF (DUF307 family)